MLQLDLVKEQGVIHGSVHAGFYEALFYPLLDTEHSVFQKICLELVAALKGNNKKLFITGHSLGEYLCACLSTVDYCYRYRYRRCCCCSMYVTCKSAIMSAFVVRNATPLF